LSLKAFNLSGKIITTPFTFAATAQSILWNDCQPVFVDIDPVTFNIDPLQVEMAMDESISAILAVHCYGYPCELKKLTDLSYEHGKILIYDAAHAFGVEVNGESILSYGDVSIVSFHATKVFNTFEGGMIVSKDAKIKSKIDLMKNFGIENENLISEIGINSKMPEINAAMGLLQIKYLDFVTKKRSNIFDLYINMLSDVEGVILPYHIQQQEKSNFSYFPILITDDFPLNRDDLIFFMRKNGINPRKYFSPLLSDFKIFKKDQYTLHDLPNARIISESIICLPIYPDLTENDVFKIVDLIKNNKN
jgi:dTDP-4-amino-4,6-dideoxygalactose transaminase